MSPGIVLEGKYRTAAKKMLSYAKASSAQEARLLAEDKVVAQIKKGYTVVLKQPNRWTWKVGGWSWKA